MSKLKFEWIKIISFILSSLQGLPNLVTKAYITHTLIISLSPYPENLTRQRLLQSVCPCLTSDCHLPSKLMKGPWWYIGTTLLLRGKLCTLNPLRGRSVLKLCLVSVTCIHKNVITCNYKGSFKQAKYKLKIVYVYVACLSLNLSELR